MYRSVSALILCGTLGLAFAPDVAAAKNAVCVRTSLGAVVCGQTVAHREALPKQRYVTRQAATKHSWASRDHTSRYADEGPVSTKDYRGHSQAGHYERAGSDYFHKTGHQATITDPAKRARVHQALYGDRPPEVASRERGVEIYTDRSHKPVKRVTSRTTYVEPHSQKSWSHSSQQVNAAKRGSHNVVYRAPSHGQAKRVGTRQDVNSDDAAQPAKGGDQVDDRPGQGEQDQPDRN